jgi:hypothetical protein
MDKQVISYDELIKAANIMDEQASNNQYAASQSLFINKVLHQEDYIYSAEFAMKMANFTDNGDGTLSFKRPATYVDAIGEGNG